MAQAGRKVKYTWTPESKARAAELWNRRVKVEQVARTVTKEFGQPQTKHTVISLYRREGAALGMIEGTERQGARMTQTTTRKRPVRAAAPEPGIDGTLFEDLRPGQCRYPLTKPLPHLFCKDDAVHGSWCAKHFEVIKGKKL